MKCLPIAIQSGLRHGSPRSPPSCCKRRWPAAAATNRSTAGQVTVIGCDERFWDFEPDKSLPSPKIAAGEIVINQPLAEKLAAKVGDSLIVRLPRPNDIPAESALGRKIDTVRALPALKISAIIPAQGLGRFGLRPTQQLPYNAFVAIGTLQRALDQPDRANAILAAIEPSTHALSPADDGLLKAALAPKLADHGLSIQKTPAGYFNLTADRMLLEPPIERAVEQAFADLGSQPVFTYLANYILAGDGKAKIPYSTVAALDPRDKPPLGPFLTPNGKTIDTIKDDEIVLNSWAADDLAKQGVTLKPGDTIQLQYFEPEILHGEGQERTSEFRLKAIVELAGAAADQNLTPELKGVTDRQSIANWNPPFKFDPDRVRSRAPHNEDDQYWRKYHATPKAFVSLATGRKLWSSRFGDTTSWRIPPSTWASLSETRVSRLGETRPLAELSKRLEAKLDPAALGFQFLPIKRIGLEAASGTTPFSLLFLGFSFFIIAAAVMLVALLFKLGIDGRAAEIGTLLAVGFRRRRIRRLLLGEGAVVAIIGGLLGVAAGLGYAWLMIEGLRTWWLAAIVTPFLQLHVTGESLVIGFAVGVIVSLATIAWSLRQQSRGSVRSLLAGDIAPADATRAGDVSPRIGRRWPRIVGIVALLAAIALAAALGGRMSGEEQAGVFFTSGFLLLIGLLLLLWDRLRSDRGLGTAGRESIAAPRPAQRRPPADAKHAHDRTDGGGQLHHRRRQRVLARTAKRACRTQQRRRGFRALRRNRPADLSRPELARRPQGASLRKRRRQAARRRRDHRPPRQSGDDASCLNLYQPRQPRILGVPPALVKHDGFDWSATAATTQAERDNPWLLLDEKPHGGSATAPIPVVLDAATATYSLHLDGVGAIYNITDSRGQQVSLRVVGLLQNSLFQGDLLIREADLVRLFPESSGKRVFLVDTKQQSPSEVARVLDAALGDYGFDAESSRRRLESFMAVQNTYLSTFQRLGGLGLLLGTIGLAVVQLRSVIERRGELALMRAIGFRRRRLAGMVLLENAALLTGGLAIGIIAALVAILPQLLSGRATTPWLSLAETLGLVLAFGLTAGTLAVRATLRAPLVPALRDE